MISSTGKLIRMPASGIPVVGRATQGVRVMRVDTEETVTSLERLVDRDGDDDIEEAAPIQTEPEDTVPHEMDIEYEGADDEDE